MPSHKESKKNLDAQPDADEMLDEIVAVIPQEGDDLSVDKEPVMEDSMDMVEAEMPEQEIMEDLYSSIYGSPMDDSDMSMQQMEELKLLLEAMPELSSALASGEITPSEASIMIFREAAELA
tara:strand:- start:5451 stop:5816 length:366 start_codon:yes stop_codon:yes gene_type:complete